MPNYKYYKQCQKHGQSPGCFAFNLKNNLDFNYNIMIDIMYIENMPVLYLVNKITRFQVRQRINNVSAQYV